MSAEDFVDRYMNLEVEVNEWTAINVSLNKYAIGYHESRERNAVQNAAKAKQLAPMQAPFARANSGKVSPADCEYILTMAVDSGVVKRERSSLQAWADKNLGVDCTGFAVAYYDDIDLIDIDKYNGGASCFTLLNRAKKNNRPSDGGPLIWELDNVEIDDMILWMNDAQVETRSPGHIALIYDIDYNLGILYTAESNGANDGHGHYGPKITERKWVGKNQSKPHYIQLGKSDKVIIVRPPSNFG
jgi:hypothetical protein